MKKYKFRILGAFVLILLNFLFSGYGNRKVHPNLNMTIVERFQSKFITSLVPLERFKNYTFALSSSVKYSGNEIIEGGLLRNNIVEKKSEKNPVQWIMHGGLSADEPEIFASFRHFYDPTLAEGNRYLHDHLDYLTGHDNPKIDIIEWTLSHAEHQYNWENGKAAVANALNCSDEVCKSEEMGFAYRALGETLHMIADLGCPAHVRDDSHATEPFTGAQVGSYDPYEEIFEELSDINVHFGKGVVDPNLKDYFLKAKTVKDISIKLATYTNAHFFTAQTISGKDVKPLIHPEKTYPSPKLEDCKYNDLDFTYRKMISGNEVIMCKSVPTKAHGYPFIDKECVISQGKALVPQIKEAGANTIRLFIPELTVKIENYDEITRKITGKVIHITNEEYPRMIKYNGKVSIYNTKNRAKITDVECDDGIINADIKLNDFKLVDWKNSGIYAQIDFGSIFVKSEPYKKMNIIKSKISKIWFDCKINHNDTYTWSGGSRPVSSSTLIEYLELKNITQNGNIITAIFDTTYHYDQYKETVAELFVLKIELRNDTIINFVATRNHKDDDSSTGNLSSSTYSLSSIQSPINIRNYWNRNKSECCHEGKGCIDSIICRPI